MLHVCLRNQARPSCLDTATESSIEILHQPSIWSQLIHSKPIGPPVQARESRSAPNNTNPWRPSWNLPSVSIATRCEPRPAHNHRYRYGLSISDSWPPFGKSLTHRSSRLQHHVTRAIEFPNSTPRNIQISRQFRVTLPSSLRNQKPTAGPVPKTLIPSSQSKVRDLPHQEQP